MKLPPTLETLGTLQAHIAPQHHYLWADATACMALPQAFVDSTHQLWRLEGARGVRVLKVCRRANLHHSSFWQAMQALFGLQLPEQLHEYSVVYSQLAQWSPLEIPFFTRLRARKPAICWVFISRLHRGRVGASRPGDLGYG